MELKASKHHVLSPKDVKHYAAQSIEDGPIMLVRVHDWQERFVEFIHESRIEGVKCDWEFNHCAGWCAQGIEEITGYDFFAPFKPLPINTPLDAFKALKHEGFDTLDQFVEASFVEKPIIYANRGDLIMVPGTEGDFGGLGMSNALGLADPPLVWVLAGGGLGYTQLADCTRCFAVGSLG